MTWGWYFNVYLRGLITIQQLFWRKMYINQCQI